MDEIMNTRLLEYSITEQRDILHEAKRVMKNRDKRAEYLTQLPRLVEDKEQLADYDCQLQKVQDESGRAAKMAAMIKENLRMIQVGKIRAKLQKAEKVLGKEERRTAKNKADEAAAAKAKAAGQREKKQPRQWRTQQSNRAMWNTVNNSGRSEQPTRQQHGIYSRASSCREGSRRGST